MAGGPAHILPGAVAPIGPWSASKTQMRILYSLPKFTSRIRPQNPRQNRLFAPKTRQAVWIRPLQTKVMCKPLPEMDRTNSGSSASEGLIKSAFELVNAVVEIVVEGKFRVVCEEVALFLLRLLLGFKRFKEELELMQCFLDDDESKQNAVEGSEDIRDQVYFEIRDVIDDIDISGETTQRRRLGVAGRVERFISLQLITRIIVACKILEITLKIRGIFTGRKFYGILREIKEGRQKASSSIQSLQDRRRYSAENEAWEPVVGLQEEIKTVRERLINGEQTRCVISIVGMAGSGKTTLARHVYEFDDVKKHFQCSAFISLSQQYEIKDVLMRIIKDVMGLSREENEKLNEEELREEELRGMLRDYLTNKKYLVVIDDIWSEKAWDMLELVLPKGKDKSRVMLTTRKRNVALYADPSPPVEMPFLDDDEGWELLTKKIFPPSTACPSELEGPGRRIIEECGGLPLVILAIGGLLARKEKTNDAWSKVLNSVHRRLTKGLVLDSVHVHPTKDPEWCMKILALSYWDLPYYLRPCFLYFGLFPEDYEIDSAKLIRLWIAEGFIQQRSHKIIEDDAEEYLEELIQRSMIQVSWKQHDGSFGGCRIHDLFHQFAILKAQKNNFFTIHNVEGTQSLPNNIRRLALHRSINGYHPTSTLRSILDFSGTIGISGSEIRQAKFLRVISQDFMHRPRKAALIKELKEFFHLRYLGLVENSGSLPSLSLGDLDNLQTLALTQFYGSLSNVISNLKQLRHLDAPSSRVGDLRVKDLTNLQTLSLPAGNWLEDGFGNLTNLRNLTIFWLPELNDERLTLLDSIEKLQSLRSLSIIDGLSHLPQLMPFTNHVHLYEMSLYGRMEKLPELPPNLTVLTLCESRLEQDHISKLEKLPRLKILILSVRSYKSEKMIFSSGGFPQLEFLQMVDVPLKEWIIEEGAMPSLKGVELYFMRDLKTQTLPERVRVLLKQDF